MTAQSGTVRLRCQGGHHTPGTAGGQRPTIMIDDLIRTFTTMASTTVTVGSTVGLHARPATIIAEAAANYDDEILLSLPGEDDEEPSDASSSLMIMALGAEHGDEVTVSSDNAEAVEAIAALITKNLDEE